MLPGDLLRPVLSFLEARDLCAMSVVSSQWSRCASMPQLWKKLIVYNFGDRSDASDDLMYNVNFCFDPKRMYFRKYQMHLGDVEVLRAEARHRDVYRQEQAIKQKTLKILNWILVRATDCVLSLCLFVTIGLAYLHHDGVVSLLAVFLPVFVAEAWMLLVVVGITLALHFRPGNPTWAFISNRIRGPMRNLIACTSITMAIVIVLLLSGALPLLWLALEGRISTQYRYVPAFGTLCLAGIIFIIATARRPIIRTAMLSSIICWVPLIMTSVMFCLKLSNVFDLSAFWILLPYIFMISLVATFVTFLFLTSLAMYFARYPDWTDYAMAALTLSSALIPFVVLIVVVLGFANGTIGAEVFYGFAIVSTGAVFLSSLCRARLPAADSGRIVELLNN
eukprot:GEMP01061391.1.p1 GENE.GEMP01061391.1~~GEMP01061391.1.p1  ORF type:complete len:393 (+),score=56.46 GEMP01061391.1:73-1251(+)